MKFILKLIILLNIKIFISKTITAILRLQEHSLDAIIIVDDTFESYVITVIKIYETVSKFLRQPNLYHLKNRNIYIYIYIYIQYIYINIYIYIYIYYLPVNAIVRLLRPRSGDSQGQRF